MLGGQDADLVDAEDSQSSVKKNKKVSDLNHRGEKKGW